MKAVAANARTVDHEPYVFELMREVISERLVL